MGPEITKIVSTEFSYPLQDVGTDEHGFNLVYDPDSTTDRSLFAIEIHLNYEAEVPSLTE